MLYLLLLCAPLPFTKPSIVGTWASKIEGYPNAATVPLMKLERGGKFFRNGEHVGHWRYKDDILTVYEVCLILKENKDSSWTYFPKEDQWELKFFPGREFRWKYPKGTLLWRLVRQK